MRVKNFIPYLLTVLIILAGIGMVYFNMYLASEVQIQDHFASRWMAAKVWIESGSSPYSEEARDATLTLLDDQGILDPLITSQRYNEPAFNLILYLPFAFIPYEIARGIWLLIIEIALAGSVIICCKIVGLHTKPIELGMIVLLGFSWYPSLKAILFGDASAVYIFICLLAFWLAINNRGTGAGFLLALCIGIIEISLLLAVFLIIWRLTRKDTSLLLAYSTGVGFLVLVSWILFQGWFNDWFATILTTYTGTSFFSTPLMRLASLFPGAEITLNLVLHIGVIIYVLFEWFSGFGRIGRIVTWKIALTYCLFYLVNPHSQVIYLYLLLPAFLMILRFFSERWRNFGKILSWFLVFSVIILYWNTFLNRGGWNLVEPTLILLLMPLLVLVGMNWIRWWALQRPDPIVDQF